jgi:putative addiction module antidote
MIELKVRRFGKSLGVILPSEVLSHLNSGDGERLFLIEDAGGEYRLTACDPAFSKRVDTAEAIIKRYRNTLCELAK